MSKTSTSNWLCRVGASRPGHGRRGNPGDHGYLPRRRIGVLQSGRHGVTGAFPTKQTKSQALGAELAGADLAELKASEHVA